MSTEVVAIQSNRSGFADYLDHLGNSEDTKDLLNPLHSLFSLNVALKATIVAIKATLVQYSGYVDTFIRAFY